MLTEREIIGIDVPTQREVFTFTHGARLNRVVMVDRATGASAARWKKALAG